MIKTIIIFANSVKHKQHCVAGKDVITKQWIRPVGDVNGCELTDSQTMYQNPHGKYLAKPLQKMNINFIQHAPLLNQPENYVISNDLWTQNYKIERDDTENFLDNPNDLWIDGVSKEDRVNFALIQSGNIPILQSLYLIKIYNPTIDKQTRRAIFDYNGLTYNLAITDPKIMHFNDNQKFYYFVISLGENFNGFCYKLVAAIL